MTAEIFQLRDFQNPKDLARLYSAEYEAEVAACMGPPQTLERMAANIPFVADEKDGA